MVSPIIASLYTRYTKILKRKPSSILIMKPANWYALVIAWRDTTRSTCWSGVWEGPGIYKLSGYNDDNGYPIATITWEKKSPQMEFNL
jgi:hypothetical protein